MGAQVPISRHGKLRCTSFVLSLNEWVPQVSILRPGKLGCTSFVRPLTYLRGYCFVCPVRVLVTEKLPSGSATTFNACPSPSPLGLAISHSGLLCAASESSAVCSCHRSIKRGLSCTICHAA